MGRKKEIYQDVRFLHGALQLLMIFKYIINTGGLHERTEHLDIFLFSAHHSVVFTGGRRVSDFSVLTCYYLNINYSVNILNKCLRVIFGDDTEYHP